MKSFVLLSFLLVQLASFSQLTDSNTLTPTIIPSTSVKDQYLSGTCWSFAGNSFLESELLRKGVKEVDLSEMFTAQHAWVQKTTLHLQYKGKNKLTPGSQFHNLVWVLKKYGVVPESVFTGKPNGTKNHNHSLLDTTLTRYIAGLAKQGKDTPELSEWQYIYSTLEKNLGKSPASFQVNGKNFTPPSYLKSLPLNLDEYAEISSYTHHPYYQAFVLENEYNYSYDKYMNVPLTDFITITDSALANGYTVLWNGDATDDGFNFDKGIAVLHNVKDVAGKRQESFEDSTSYMDHMMHIVGYVKDNDGRKWYYVKNSWGTGNSLKGYLMMDENYFAIKTAAIVVNKRAIPLSINKKINW